MAFTKDNLNSYPTKGRVELSEERWSALVSRLGAAERVCEIIRSISGYGEVEVAQEWLFIYPALDEWVKEAGKE